MSRRSHVKHRNTIVVAVLAMIAALIPATALAIGDGITINEIRIDQPDADEDEYFELTGPADTPLDGLTYIVIGDGTGGSGVIESVTDLSGHSLDDDGFFVAAESTFSLGTADLTTGLGFENSDNVTHLLVQEFSGANGDDLDTNDDGVLDVTPWAAPIVDLIALVEEEGEPPSNTEFHYGPPTVGPDGSFVPGQVYDCIEDGWTVGEFGVGITDTPGEVNICDAPPVEPTPLDIPTIQGEGFASPHVGEFVLIDGVVTAVFQDDPVKGRQLGGFFVQEEEARDSNDATSEGIFVFAPFADVAVGDVVEVVGSVAEFDQLTEITNVESVTVTGSASIAPTEFTLPATDAAREAVEGMLLTLTQDLHIVEFFNYDRTNEVVLATTRQFQGTHSAPPGPQAVAIAEENALNQITIDDGRTSQNPDWNQHPDGSEFTENNSFRGGDLLLGVTGVMHEGVPHPFEDTPDYRIQPTGPATHVETNPRPTAPDNVGGNVTVASFNVLNFFTHLDDGVNDICGPTGDMECRGADTAEELDRQLTKLVAGILALDADIVGIQEIENDIRDDEPVVPNRSHDPVLTLVEALNAADRGGTWAWVGETNHYNDYPVRNDIIYRKSAVTPVGEPVALADDAFDKSRPETPGEPVGRPPVAQAFRAHGPGAHSTFTVVVNHFKSKGSSCASIGDPDAGDGQGNCNLTRVAQSVALIDFVDELSENSSGVLVIGDLNSYAMEDPITTLEDAGLTDLVEEFVGPNAYSFVFDGQLGYLDTALATASMLNRVTGTTVFHINADEPDIIDYDTSFKSDSQIGFYEPTFYRASDHDPVIVGIRFGEPPGHGPGFTPPGPPPGPGSSRFR
ncbi:MAG TPA: ExeM/NucH family extracellular endonuclease [Acidimicrobiia bacterium]